MGGRPAEPLGQREKPWQGCQRPGRDDPGLARRDGFDPAGSDLDLGPGGTGDLPQERGFALVRLDELAGPHPADGKNEAGKASAAAEIDDGPWLYLAINGKVRQELRGIEHVPPPGIL